MKEPSADRPWIHPSPSSPRDNHGEHDQPHHPPHDDHNNNKGEAACHESNVIMVRRERKKRKSNEAMRTSLHSGQ